MRITNIWIYTMVKINGTNLNYQYLKQFLSQYFFWFLFAAMVLIFALVFSPITRFDFGSLFYSIIGEKQVNSLLEIIQIEKSNMSIFLSTGAAIFATVLAIFFSISLYTIQHAANNYAPSILSDYKSDKKTQIIFLIFSTSVVFNLLSLIFDWGIKSVYASIWMSIFYFILLAFQFYNTIDLINPLTVINKIEKKVIKKINQLPKKTEILVKSKNAQKALPEAITKNPVHKYIIFHSESSLHEENKEYVSHLIYIIQRAAKVNEYESCVAGLISIAEISKVYIDVRKKDPTAEDKFLEFVYEKLFTIEKIAFENRDTTLLQELSKTFENIGISTSRIEVISSANGYNPITNLAAYYIQKIGLKSSQKKLYDSAGQAINSLESIGVASSQLKLDSNVSSISDNISEIGIICAKKGEWFVINKSISALGMLAIYSIANKLGRLESIEPIFKNIETILDEYISKSNSNKLELQVQSVVAPITAPMSLVSGIELVKVALFIKNEKYEQIETHWRENYSKEIISEIIEFLQKIGTILAKKHLIFELRYLTKQLKQIGSVCLDEEFITFEDNLDDEIVKLVGSISGFYFTWEISHKPSQFISESLAFLGLQSIEKNNESISNEIINNLYDMAVYTMRFVNNKEYAHDIASKIGLLGAFAIEKKNVIILDKCLEKLIDFENEYSGLYPKFDSSIHIKQLINDKPDLKGYPSQLVENDLYSKIPEEYLHKFVDMYTQKHNM